MFERHVFQIEMNAFKQDIGSNERLLLPKIEHGSIITYTLKRGLIMQFDIFGKTRNQTKLTQFFNFHI